ncbi:MAG: O-antigen ligase family protein [Anaeromyxobacteraceae bacterium]
MDLWVVTAFAVAALGAALSRGHAHYPATAVAMLLAVLVALLQLAPLPPWLHFFSPGARSVFQAALQPLGLYPSWRPLSLAPGEGLRTLPHALALLATFIAARSVAEHGADRRRLALSVALAGVGTAAAVVFLALTGATSFVEPHLPFVNPNHLAALTGFAAITAAGVAAGEAGTGRLPWLAGAALAAVVTLLTLSRSGFMALLGGAVVLLVLDRRARSEGIEERTTADRGWPARLAPAVTGVAAVVIAVAVLAYEPVTGEVRSIGAFSAEAKPRLWLTGLGMLWPFALLGMGRGAFATVSSAHWLEPAPYTYTHVENTWLQLLLDLGIPTGGLLIAALAWTWLSAARDAKRGSSDVALLAGLAALFVHDLADFSLETLGVGIPAAAALGLLSRKVPSYRVPPWAFHLVGVVALAGALTASVAYSRIVAPAQAAVLPGAAAPDPRVAGARALWYAPSDYVVAANVGASLEAQGHCAQAMPWLSSATFLDPSAPEPHLLLARCLKAGGKLELARQETVLTIALGDPRGYQEAIETWAELADLVRAVPATPDHLLALGERLGFSRPDDAAHVLRTVLDEYLDDRALLPLAQVELMRKQPDAALELARRAQRSRTPSKEAWRLAYSALVTQGNADGADEELPGRRDALSWQRPPAVSPRRACPDISALRRGPAVGRGDRTWLFR